MYEFCGLEIVQDDELFSRLEADMRIVHDNALTGLGSPGGPSGARSCRISRHSRRIVRSSKGSFVLQFKDPLTGHWERPPGETDDAIEDGADHPVAPPPTASTARHDIVDDQPRYRGYVLADLLAPDY